MKAVPVLLCSLLGLPAFAQPINRCLDSAGHIVAYQDRPCPATPVAAVVAPAEPADPAEPAESTEPAESAESAKPADAPGGADQLALFDGASDLQGGWTTWQRRQRQREAKVEYRADDARMRLLLQPANERRHAEYAQSQHRCQVARQIASLCGAAGHAFSCDEKGFRAESSVDLEASSPGGALGRSQTLRRDQCALQLTRGRD